MGSQENSWSLDKNYVFKIVLWYTRCLNFDEIPNVIYLKYLIIYWPIYLYFFSTLNILGKDTHFPWQPSDTPAYRDMGLLVVKEHLRSEQTEDIRDLIAQYTGEQGMYSYCMNVCQIVSEMIVLLLTVEFFLVKYPHQASMGILYLHCFLFCIKTKFIHINMIHTTIYSLC